MPGIIETKWDAALKALGEEGLSKEKAKEVLTGAMGFIFAVDHQRNDQYLTAEVKETYGKTLRGLAEITQKYPDVKGVLAYLFLEEVKKEGKLKLGRILTLCLRATRIGIVNEWMYLGKEVRKWRLAGRKEGEVGIHFSVLNASVHVFDRRSDDQTRWGYATLPACRLA